jgi:hypothetical protein
MRVPGVRGGQEHEPQRESEQRDAKGQAETHLRPDALDQRRIPLLRHMFAGEQTVRRTTSILANTRLGAASVESASAYRWRSRQSVDEERSKS